MALGKRLKRYCSTENLIKRELKEEKLSSGHDPIIRASRTVRKRFYNKLSHSLTTITT
jgi:hypothetical protein